MKLILDITKALRVEKFYKEQFDKFADSKEVNINGKNVIIEGRNLLFMNPQLSGKNLYKTFLPYYHLFSEYFFTAFSSISKYNPKEQLQSLKVRIDTVQLTWADYVVIPFTTDNLTSEENNLYESIRNINQQCKIVFMVDFNYYELSDLHPYRKIFNDRAINQVEENIWFCDICLVSNMVFMNYLRDELTKISSGSMKNIPTKAKIACIPFYADSKLLLANVDYNPQEPKHVNGGNKYDKGVSEQMKKVSDVANPIVNKKQIKVILENDKWVLKKGSYKKPLEIYAKKSLAINEANKFIKDGYDIIIYKTDGTIQKTIIFKPTIVEVKKKTNKNGK